MRSKVFLWCLVALCFEEVALVLAFGPRSPLSAHIPLIRTCCTRSSPSLRAKVARDGNLHEDSSLDALASASSGRRSKKNKYAQFSKVKQQAVLETVDEAIDKSDLKEQKKKEIEMPIIRGTTVPTKKASTSLLRRKRIKTSFKDYKTVVPSDASSFGYIQIGTIGLPHGIKGEVKVVLHDTDFAAARLLGAKQPSPAAAVDSSKAKAGVSSGAMDNAEELVLLYIKKPNRHSPRPIRVVSARPTGNTAATAATPANNDDSSETFTTGKGDNVKAKVWLVQFDGIHNRNGAKAFQGYSVHIREEDRPAMANDEYLIRDLVGLPVYRFNANDNSDNDNNDTDSEIATVVGVVPPDELCDSTSSALISKMHAMLELKLLHNDKLCLIPLVPQIVRNVVLKGKEEEGAMYVDPPAGLLDLSYTAKPKRVIIRGYLPASATGLTKQERKEFKHLRSTKYDQIRLR